MEVFKNNPKQSMARGLVKGVDYVEVLDGNGYAHKIVNLDNPKYCATEGIIELEAMKISNKHDNKIIIRRTKDRKTGLFWGEPINISEETKQLQWKPFILENRKTLDLSIPEQAREWAILKNSTAIEGSANLYGKPYYRVIDKEEKAKENVNRRIIRQKAEAIIARLSGKPLEEMAINLGVNIEANRNLAMLTDEVYRKMEENPTAFIKMYEDPNRQYISILNRGLALGILSYDIHTSTYKYGGLDMGGTKEMAAKYLIDNNNLASSIDSKCNIQEAETLEAMRASYDESHEEVYDEVAELRLKLELAENKLKENGLVEEVVFKSPFADTQSEESELTSLKERAKELKISGYALMKKETLMAKIAELES